MTEDELDRDRSKKVYDAASAFNLAVKEAIAIQLRVDVDVLDAQSIGDRFSVPMLNVAVLRVMPNE